MAAAAADEPDAVAPAPAAAPEAAEATAASLAPPESPAAAPAPESAPSLIDNEERVAVDVGGSYSIARNIAITGGVRYQRQHRLAQEDVDRQDSQAVYVGTAFRF